MQIRWINYYVDMYYVDSANIKCLIGKCFQSIVHISCPKQMKILFIKYFNEEIGDPYTKTKTSMTSQDDQHEATEDETLSVNNHL